METRKTNYPHPGEILKAEFMIPMGLNQNTLARALGVAPSQIHRLVTGKQGVSAEMALRFSRYFGTSAEMWLNLQKSYELRVAKKQILNTIEKTITPYQAA